MPSEDDFQYALENTEVIRPPAGQIQTFGTTSFRFFLITECMDRVDQVRVRDGQVHAERPQIIAPGHYSKLLLEGFGDKAQGFADWLESNASQLAVLKYGFNFRRGEVTENLINRPLAEVVDQVNRRVDEDANPLSAVIQGVDDAWEVCLLKFTVDLIQKSSGGNLGDFRSRGLV